MKRLNKKSAVLNSIEAYTCACSVFNCACSCTSSTSAQSNYNSDYYTKASVSHAYGAVVGK